MTPEEFEQEPSIFRLMVNHPIPWRYKNGKIFDENNEEVVSESKVSSFVFDMIWATYYIMLRPLEKDQTNGNLQ